LFTTPINNSTPNTTLAIVPARINSAKMGKITIAPNTNSDILTGVETALLSPN
jgi:hypothetical protein